jgi:hypothetical protein
VINGNLVLAFGNCVGCRVTWQAEVKLLVWLIQPAACMGRKTKWLSMKLHGLIHVVDALPLNIALHLFL